MADDSGVARRARDARGFARRVRLDGRGRHAGAGRRQGGARPAVEGGKAGEGTGARAEGRWPQYGGGSGGAELGYAWVREGEEERHMP